MGMPWLTGKGPSCPKCQNDSEGALVPGPSGIAWNGVFKLIYAIAAVLTYLMIHNIIVVSVTVCVAMVAAWFDYKLTRYYKCKVCGHVYTNTPDK